MKITIICLFLVVSSCGHRYVSDKPWTLKNISDAIERAV
ncbi:hypothetical protein P106B_45 [Rhizobium phage vB_RglS_P106B]|uniref:Uncharacterized protein n=1 Tax=Rhizobium phage vB_RglS_P106B TaxID=1458697 RepID=W6E9Q7_9CAUD|nr:hypothetical protein P106B_45 [Rhizobium phage vB_RglS_P106B]AHJ10728.1 hypothetical protein P106B_45 [Rhizobium phage vB_RglS_P106B]